MRLFELSVDCSEVMGGTQPESQPALQAPSGVSLLGPRHCTDITACIPPRLSLLRSSFIILALQLRPALARVALQRAPLPFLHAQPLHSSSRVLMSNPWDIPLTKPVEELNTYLAVLPDFKEGSKRMSVRPTHLEQSKAGKQHGWISKL